MAADLAKPEGIGELGPLSRKWRWLARVVLIVPSGWSLRQDHTSFFVAPEATLRVNLSQTGNDIRHGRVGPGRGWGAYEGHVR